MTNKDLAKDAVDAGMVFFTPKNPCRKCGSSRYYSKCVQCERCSNMRGYERRGTSPKKPKDKESPEVIAKRKREANRQWKRDNPHKVRSYKSRRRSLRLKATPRWYCKKSEVAMHLLSICREPFDGECHLDHIIPLTHPKVCGLHCSDNWQVLTKSQNLSKGNKWDGTYDNGY